MIEPDDNVVRSLKQDAVPMQGVFTEKFVTGVGLNDTGKVTVFTQP